VSAAAAPTPYRRARHLVRTRFSESPTFYLPFARRKYPGPSPEVIGPDTELVIDGYTRSASTFAVYALQLAQDRPVRLAHHLHAPAQLVRAARTGVPALLLIREPRGAILSQLVREPDVAMRDALVAYSRFHARLLPHLHDVVVGEFQQVTTEFGVVIDRLNARFGLGLRRFEHTPESTDRCLELIAHRPSLSPVLLGFESGLVDHAQLRRELATPGATTRTAQATGDTWIPSAERDARKESLREQWQATGLARLRERAERLYEQFAATAA
jgi:hypothetical protein